MLYLGIGKILTPTLITSLAELTCFTIGGFPRIKLGSKSMLMPPEDTTYI